MEERVNNSLARRFLLGELGDDERASVESRFMTDPGTKTTILLAEEDLIEDYLEQNLSASEYEKFLAQYGATAAQRRKLRIAHSIKQQAMKQQALSLAAAPSASIVSPEKQPGWFAQFWSVPRLAVGAIILILFVAGIALIWRINRRNPDPTRQAIARELAELNSPNAPQFGPSQIFSATLAPVSLRSGSSQNEIRLRSDIRVVELRLISTTNESYQSYQSSVRRVAGTDEIMIANLARESADRSILVRLPATVLETGQYQITLRGIDRNGASVPLEEYTFVVAP